ncbi:trypsin-like peptidase domain-containing protein [Amphritea sp. 1_MG-2023]|uniref:S1C family serine protease n=1 Tax=Amphritea sp. 1_MG-2023 TaxID=3062670 RepID=UPI0026E13B52|nr:trypsin-like peptidase domain-containing protein [Amphritea sp. 1_MG-2023]MDO6564395.1 trypsin-like peptidase domain-containing protein [Amphritea sp. 1_MG-2023]
MSAERERMQPVATRLKAEEKPEVSQAKPEPLIKKEGLPRVLSAVELFEQNSPTVHMVYAVTFDQAGEAKKASSGSGVMITPNYMVTNYHVIDGHNFIATRDQRDPEDIIEWDVIRQSKEKDLAILRSPKEYPYIKKFIRVNKVKVGQKVYAIGSPEGLENTLSEGIVSGKRKVDTSWFIQTTVDMTHGSSGGALFSDTGALIGITTKGKEGGGNLNFAIPMDSVESLIRNK